MKIFAHMLGVCLFWIVTGVSSAAAPLEITLSPDEANPPLPQMGDHMKFSSIISNGGTMPAQGVVVWISLIQIDPGHEQPVDLEGWSAHKAVTRATLAPGEQFTVEWPMRLMQAGDYRVVISAVERPTSHIITSPFVDFHVKRKPVVESRRIMPVAIGVPVVIGTLALWRVRKNINL